MELQIGDIVWLKSDPNAVFTIGKFVTIDGDKSARVYWFNYSTKELNSQNIPLAALTK